MSTNVSPIAHCQAAFRTHEGSLKFRLAENQILLNPLTLIEMEKTIGVISEDTFSFEWKIENFPSLSDKNGDQFESPQIECFDAIWNVSLYPNGNGNKTIGWISVFLRKKHPKDSSRIVDMKISMKCGSRILKIVDSPNTDFSVNSSLGWDKFLTRNQVLEKLKTLQRDLTFSCVIAWKRPVADTESQGSSLESVSTTSKPKASVKNLIHSLKDLYVNQINCDFTINVKDHMFPAHKLILGARSSVFAHNMTENLSGTMNIDDFEPDIVNDFLMYIYTGDVENLSWENVFELYEISDKYDVQDLEEECLEFMKIKLSLETVCEVLLLAEKYGEAELLKLAKNFVAKHAMKIVSSDHWEILASENISLAHKILKMIVLDNAWRIR